jgi:DNA end-binding protein Ku
VKPPPTKPNSKELDLAEKLIDGMSEKFSPKKYKDTYYDDLMNLIDKKIDAGQTETSYTGRSKNEKKERPTKSTDIMTLLKKSLKKSA